MDILFAYVVDDNYTIIDRGHKHSNGASEACFWIRPRRTVDPGTLNANAEVFVPAPTDLREQGAPDAHRSTEEDVTPGPLPAGVAHTAPPSSSSPTMPPCGTLATDDVRKVFMAAVQKVRGNCRLY